MVELARTPQTILFALVLPVSLASSVMPRRVFGFAYTGWYDFIICTIIIAAASVAAPGGIVGGGVAVAVFVILLVAVVVVVVAVVCVKKRKKGAIASRKYICSPYMHQQFELYLEEL